MQMRESAEECSTMDASMSINGDVSNTGVTTFTNEACDAVNMLPKYFGTEDLDVQEDLQDLKRYFERPRLVRRGEIPFGTRGTVADLIIDRNAFTSTFPQWNNRLAGAYGIRFTMNFRVQVACTSFHQGLLALGFQYTDPLDTFWRGGYPFSVTNLPHVRLDLTENTMVEFKVPFLYMNDFYTVLSTQGVLSESGYGRVVLSTVLPVIAVSGLTTPTFELYCHLSDIELIAADNAASSTIVLQSGGVVAKEMKESHLLSKGLAMAAKITRFIGNNVPSISAIAGPASWVMDTASGVAKYFGYSRPLIQDPSMLVLRNDFTAENNIDVPMTGYVVGTFKGNSLSVFPGFAATDVDEMSFDFIKSQYSQVCYAQVSNTDSHGNAIYASPVSPSVWWFRAPTSRPYCNITYPANSSDIDPVGNCFFPSHLMNLASFFRFWRGGVIYRFTFAKTKFHGGRYMVSYNPKLVWNAVRQEFVSVEGPELNTDNYVQPYGYSKIMDLKDGNVFEFHVPFTSETPYIPFTSSVGSISIVCIDPLSASGSVTNTIPLLVEIKGDVDFEVADYAGPMFITQNFGIIYTQSGGDAVVRSVVKEPAPQTIGEKMMSVKQIIQTPTWYRFSQPANTTTPYNVFPWYVNYNNYEIGGGSIPNDVGLIHKGSSFPANIWAKCYLFAKGGTDIHMYAASNDLTFSAVQAPDTGRNGYVDTNQKDYSFRGLTANLPRVIANAGQALHARFPAFQYTRRVQPRALDGPAENWQSIITSGVGLNACHYNIVQVTNNNTSNSANYLVGRAASDDAALGHYVGPIPYFIPNVFAENPLDADEI